MGFGVAVRIDIHALLARWADDVVDAGGEIRRRPRWRTCCWTATAPSAEPPWGPSAPSSPRARCFWPPAAFRGIPTRCGSSSAPGRTRCRCARTPARRATACEWDAPPGRRWPVPWTASTATWCPARWTASGPRTSSPSRSTTRASACWSTATAAASPARGGATRSPTRPSFASPAAGALLLCDERIRREHAVGPPYPHGQVVDRFELARAAGARIESVATLEQLADLSGAGAGMLAERGLSEPPFWALEVQPTLTFTFGGLAADADGQVRDPHGGRSRACSPRAPTWADCRTPATWAASSSASSSARSLRTRPSNGAHPLSDPDVLIIGAGPSGAVTAKRLSEAGMSVVCLEQGDWPDYEKARSRHPDYELTPGSTGPGTPTCAPRRATIRSRTPIPTSPRSCGTAWAAARWCTPPTGSATCPRTSGSARSTAWPTTGRSATRSSSPTTCGWSATGASPATPTTPPFRRARDRRCPPCRSSPMGRRVAKAHNDLGWHWWPGPNAIATERYGALNPCVQRATCLWGCADGAKATVDRTYWPGNQKAGVELRIRSRVRRLLRRRRRADRGRRVPRRATATSTSSGPASRSSAPTASGRPGCCSSPTTTAASPTPRGWWASA